MLLDARERERGFLGLRNSYWGPSVMTLKGRVFPLVPMILYFIYCCSVLIITLYPLHGSQGLAQLSNIKDVASMIGFGLFLLLSFRNQSSYARWYEAAEKWNLAVGGIQEAARRVAARAIANKPTEAIEMLWWLVAALECMKCELRRSEDLSYIYPLLPEEHMKDLLSASDRVQYSLYRYMIKALDVGDNLLGDLSMQCFLAYVDCTRILNTPFPLSYIAHLRVLLFIWLAFLPWYLAPIYGWYVLILTTIIGYAIIGVEEAASEVEQPLGIDFNDLPLDEMAEKGYQAIEVLMAIAIAREKELNLASAQSENDEVVDEISPVEISCVENKKEGEEEEEEEVVKESNVQESVDDSSSIDSRSGKKCCDEEC